MVYISNYVQSNHNTHHSNLSTSLHGISLGKSIFLSSRLPRPVMMTPCLLQNLNLTHLLHTILAPKIFSLPIVFAIIITMTGRRIFKPPLKLVENFAFLMVPSQYHHLPDDWATLQAMLILWVMNTITPEVKASIPKFKDPRRLWETLKVRSVVANGPQIHPLHASIAKCEQSKTMYVTTYYSHLHVLWEELHCHKPLLICSCCATCDFGANDAKRREKRKVHQFLMGLYTPFYGQTRAAILALENLPSLERVYQMVIQDERVRLATQPHDSRVIPGSWFFCSSVDVGCILTAPPWCAPTARSPATT